MLNIITCSFQYIFLILLELIPDSFSYILFPIYLIIFLPPLFAIDVIFLSIQTQYIRKSNISTFFFHRSIFPGVLYLSFPIWTWSSRSLIHNSYLSVSPYPFPGNFLSLTPVLNFYILDVISFFALFTHFEGHILPVIDFFRKRTKLMCLLVCLCVYVFVRSLFHTVTSMYI